MFIDNPLRPCHCYTYKFVGRLLGSLEPRGILRGVRYAKSLRVLFLHRRSPSWTTLVLYSRAVFIFNEPTRCVSRLQKLKTTVDIAILTYSYVASAPNRVNRGSAGQD
jgi:hypothetical protein